MNSRKIGALSGLVSILGFALAYGPKYALGRWADGGLGGLLPTFGSAGVTMTVYSYILNIVEPLALLTLAIGLGYYVGQRVDLATGYRRVASSIAAGSTIGVVLGVLSIVSMGSGIGTGQLPDDAVSGFLLIAVFVRFIVEIALLITVGAVAGAAITHFRSERPPRAEPSDTTTDPPGDATATTRNTDGPSDSRLVHRH